MESYFDFGPCIANYYSYLVYFFYSIIQSNLYEDYFIQSIIITIIHQMHNCFAPLFDFDLFIGYYINFNSAPHFGHLR